MSTSTRTYPSGNIGNSPNTHARADRAAIVGLLCAYAGETLHATEQWASAHDMHTTDARAMAALGDAQRSGTPMTAGELSMAIDLSSPATSALIARLESAGHIERARDPKDRRRVFLTPSPSAILGAIAYFQPLGEAVTAALDGATEQEMDVILGFLERLLRHMRSLPPA